MSVHLPSPNLAAHDLILRASREPAMIQQSGSIAPAPPTCSRFATRSARRWTTTRSPRRPSTASCPRTARCSGNVGEPPDVGRPRIFRARSASAAPPACAARPRSALSAWRGASGRRYVVGVHDARTSRSTSCRGRGDRVSRDSNGIAEKQDVAVSLGHSAGEQWLGEMRRKGCTEIHLHRLADNARERREIEDDLNPSKKGSADDRRTIATTAPPPVAGRPRQARGRCGPPRGTRGRAPLAARCRGSARITPAMTCSMERGQRRVPLERMQTVATVYGVPPSTWSGPPAVTRDADEAALALSLPPHARGRARRAARAGAVVSAAADRPTLASEIMARVVCRARHRRRRGRLPTYSRLVAENALHTSGFEAAVHERAVGLVRAENWRLRDRR